MAFPVLAVVAARPAAAAPRGGETVEAHAGRPRVAGAARTAVRKPVERGWKQMRRAWLVVLMVVAVLAAPALAQETPTIKVGAIITYTGPTSDVGSHYGDGIRDYFRWLAEEHGGIVETAFGPVRVELVWTDDQYNPQVALTALRRFVSEENIVGVITWGTGANLALMDELNRSEVPALSASFHRGLLDPPGQYNFFISTNYDNHMRVLIDYAVSQHTGANPPRIAFSVHPSPYGRSPLEAGRAYAEQLGLPVVASQELPADVLDATGQILELRRAQAEYVFFQNVAQPVSVFLRDARRQGLRAQFLGIHYAGGEELLHLAGGNADGFITTSATVTWDTDVPGMEFVRALNARYHPNTAVRPPHYTQGVVTAMVMVEAIRRAAAPDGAAVKAALETLENFDVGGVAPPITFGPDRHWGADSLYLYRLDANENRLVFIGEFAPAYD